MTTIKLESCSPLDLSSLLKEGNKKHDIKLYGAFVLSATECIDSDNLPFVRPQHHQEITLSCDYLEILNEDNKKEEKLKEQKNDDEEITW